MAENDDTQPYSLSFDTKTLDLWALYVGGNAGNIIRLHTNLALKNAAGIVQRREYKEAPRGVTGGLIKSIRQIVTEAIAAIGPTGKYSIYIEKGTKPHMPPVDAITPWAESVGINPWAVAMSIKKKGTQVNPFVKRTFGVTKTDVKAEFALATIRITSALAAKGF